LSESFAESPAPEVSDADCCGASTTEPLDDEGWPDVAFGIADFGHHLGAGADIAGRIECEEVGHAFEPLLFGGLVCMNSDPRLEPAVASEFEADSGLGESGVATEVDREQFADGRAIEAPLSEGFLAGHHEQTTSTAADEVVKKLHLISLEEVGFEVIDDHGIVAKEFFGCLRETAAKFFGGLGIEANEYGFVVFFDGVRIGAIEAAKEGVGGFAFPAAKIEFGFTASDADQSGQLQLLVGFDGSSEEFEVPVGAAGNVENASCSGGTLNGDQL
jgi:hypothetical protein